MPKPFTSFGLQYLDRKVGVLLLQLEKTRAQLKELEAELREAIAPEPEKPTKKK